MQRKTLPVKHFFIPIFLLIVALIWGAADIGKSGTIRPFLWGNLLSFKSWVEPVTFAGLDAQPKTNLVNHGGHFDIFCLQNTRYCWAVGGYGIVLRTINGGQDWQAGFINTENSLTSVYFSSPKAGWAVGHKGTIIHTTDAGQSWQVQTSNTDEYLTSVYFASPQEGWVVGDSGVILHTTDAGQSWQAQTSNTDRYLTSVYFASPQEGWAVGWGGTILHTTDAGQNWQAQTSNTEADLTSVYFTSPQEGWAVGGRGTILHTNDAGQNWQAQTIDTVEYFEGIYFTSPQEGWAIGFYGALLHTVNGGQDWEIQSSFTVPSVNSAYFTSDQEVWAVGWNSGMILHTANGGQSWQTQSSKTDNKLQSVHFSSPQEGWAVGDNGTVVHTINRGQDWQAQNSNINEDLNGVYFVSSKLGWAVGWDVILHTRNGGQSWQVQQTPINSLLMGVFFTSHQDGWAVGLLGTILHTSNGGLGWQRQTSNTDQELTSVYFASPQEGWAVGWSGTILHTSDAGQNWQAQTSNTNEDLESIYFASPKLGWAVGSNGTILHTSDAGRHWQPQTSRTDESLSSVYFTSPKHGVAVGFRGSVLQTNNGGQEWKHIFHPNQKFYEQLRDTRFGNYYHWPSPLALLLLLISLLWLFITLRTASKNPSDYLPDERGGIADAPVQFLDEDKLGYAPLARGIYKLIRNVDSKPPLAIAVSAPWGQGKSSVMNMLHSLLKNDNAVVQFNAWHYRDDNHILAALIEHIRAQAVPNGISLANLGFRWNLLWRRLLAPYWRWWAVVLPVGWFTAWQMGREFDLEWGAIHTHIEQQVHELINPLSALIGEKLASASPAIGVLLLLLASPLIVKKILAPLKSFTEEGDASLYSAAWNNFKATLQTTSRDWGADAGIRFQFQQDFSDICHALGSRKLVLLIDDLDRCDPKQIEQIINTLNFLFSNNMPCYVVMALDWDYVRTALGIAYKDMANALHHKIKVSKGESRAEIFAENYLRKIIQLKVELPDVDVVAAFVEKARASQEETNAIPIGKLVTRMGCDILKIFTSIKQANSANPAHRIDNVVDKLRHSREINSWGWTKPAGTFFCFLVKALVIEPIGGRLKRHGENDAYRLGNLIVTVFFACLFSALIVAALIAITGNAKSNPVSSTERVEASTVATADAQPAPPANPQKRFAKDTTNNPPMLVLDPQKNSAGPVFHLFMIGLGFVGIFWMFWFMRQERDSAEFKQALAVWKLQLSHKVKTPREWRRLENNLRFFIMLARGYDYVPAHKRLGLFLDELAARLIAYAESTNYKPPGPFVFDEGIATRLIMADVFRQGKVFEQLKADIESGGDPRGQLALDWLENSGHTIDEKLTEFFERFMDRNDEDAANQVKRWLHLHSFKLQLPYKIE